MINKDENENSLDLDYTTSAETVVAANTSEITDIEEIAFVDFLVTQTDFYSDFYSEDAPWLWID